MTSNDNIFDVYAQAYESQKQYRMSLRDYLEGCRVGPLHVCEHGGADAGGDRRAGARRYAPRMRGSAASS